MLSEIIQLTEKVPMFREISLSLIVIITAHLVNKLLIKKSIDRMGKRLKLDNHVTRPLKKVFSAVLYIIVLFIILGILGVRGSLTGLLAGAGVLGIVIGMATQDVLSGVISGIVLYIDKPFKIGDRVKIGDIEGEVKDLTLQRTKIETLDGETMTIPNSSVANDVIINRTETPKSRLFISIGVDYDSDMDKVFAACQKVFEDNDLILDVPKPRIFIQEFADSSINIELKFWVDWNELKKEGRLPRILKSELRNRIIEKFREDGIEIPFPHMEIIKK